MAIKLRGPAGLYGIIALKMIKGIFFLSLGLGLFQLVDNDLPEDFRRLLSVLHVDPERRFFQNLEARLETVTPKLLIGLASGSFLYSIPSLAESAGLLFRRPWAGWLALGESAFFIPIEVFELTHRFRIAIFFILLINIMIVWYLYRNRKKLFHH